MGYGIGDMDCDAATVSWGIVEKEVVGIGPRCYEKFVCSSLIGGSASLSMQQLPSPASSLVVVWF
jgi:hypothetical protein